MIWKLIFQGGIKSNLQKLDYPHIIPTQHYHTLTPIEHIPQEMVTKKINWQTLAMVLEKENYKEYRKLVGLW